MGESSKREEEIKLSAGKREGEESGNGNTHPPLSLSAVIFFVRSSGVFPVLYAFFQGRIIPLFL